MQTIHLGNGVAAVEVAPDSPVEGIREKLHLPAIRGAVAVVGGAAGFDKPQFKPVKIKVAHYIRELAALAAEANLAVVDGGTFSGYMRMLGEVHAAQPAFPLIGVAPKGRVTWPNRHPSLVERLRSALVWLDMAQVEERGQLDPNHSAFVLVKSDQWGGEVETLAQVAHHLANGFPAVEILINGGNIAKRDAAAFLGRGGHLLVLEGTGRLADEVAAAVHHGSDDAQIQSLLKTGRVSLFSIERPPADFKMEVKKLGTW